MHVTHELLLAVLDKKIPRRVLEEIVVDHLAALCPICCQEIETFDWRKYRREVPGPSIYTPVVARAAQAARTSAVGVERARRQGLRWLRELVRVPAEERAGKVERAHSRFRGDVFAELLVEEARSHLPADPWEAFSWADAALAAHHRTPGIESRPEVLVRILGHRGNALRATGRLNEAAVDLGQARKVLDTDKVTDLSIAAELDSLEASLRKDRRELQEAERLLLRAILLYRLLGETGLRARAEVKLCTVYFHQDRPDEAARTATGALEDLSPKEDALLYLSARYNVARALEALGEPDKALALLDEDRGLQEEHLAECLQLNVTWLRARIDRALGRPDASIDKLESVRQGFVETGVAYDVAMVSLELALLLLDRGETARVKKIAKEAFQVFSTQSVHREAFSSLKIFHDAAVAETLTVATVEKIHAHLRKVGTLPVNLNTTS